MNFGLIGYGSWATALTSVITKKHKLNWWLPKKNIIQHIIKYKKNPKYLKDATLNTSKINFFSEKPEQFIKNSDIIFLIVPSAYVDTHLKPFYNITEIKNKIIISGIKGFEITSNKIISEYLTEKFQIMPENIATIGGPAHAEEVIKEKNTVITLAHNNNKIFEKIAKEIQTDYFTVLTSNDLVGIEYAAILKNIYALTIGILLGQGLGDNFIAMAICSCLNEMENILEQIHPIDIRTVIHSAYLGDFLVTAYSQHSRNRRFGFLIGKGLSPSQAKQKLQMVAEGYFAIKILIEKYSPKYNLNFPIINYVYNILYNNYPPNKLKDIIPKI